ncbi:MAG TPA: FtsQ-type POTRA domain-containing protein [Candidatus Aquilonibacter sp.]|nr:FtsQ-type POTRA domain-containing protein [Candidatus Aquilonibacter sp.]
MNARPTPRRRKKSPASRLRPFWWLLLLVLVLFTASGYAFVGWDGFKPHTVRVRGNHVVHKEQILNAAGIALNTNIWLQNTGAMAKRIEAIPYIDKAWVRRLPPGTLLLDVTERTPFAVLQTGATRWLVDSSLRVLAADNEASAHLPVLVADVQARPGVTLDAPAVVGLRNDLQAMLDASIDPATVQHDRYGDVVATLHNGIRLLLGDETDLAKKLPLVNPILAQVGRGQRPIAAIDLRAPHTPVVVYKK